MLNYILSFFTSDEGADMVEYALILALVSVVAIVVLTTLGTSVQGVFSSADSALQTGT